MLGFFNGTLTPGRGKPAILLDVFSGIGKENCTCIRNNCLQCFWAAMTVNKSDHHFSVPTPSHWLSVFMCPLRAACDCLFDDYTAMPLLCFRVVGNRHDSGIG